MNYNYINTLDALPDQDKQRVIKFLYEHLEEFGDSKKSIENAIDYAMSSFSLAGGFIVTAVEDGEILGAVVMNKTGMKGYIPENILVYIAVHNEHRGRGIGKELMRQSLKYTKGDVALHVEPENPALHLYEKFNFTNKYLEMRLVKTNAEG